MPKLADNTIRSYASRLRRLRRLLAVMPSEHPEKKRVLLDIERLTNALGGEMTPQELTVLLDRKPGRRSGGDKSQLGLDTIAQLEDELSTPEERRARERAAFWSQKAIDARAAKVKERSETRVTEEASEEELKRMMKEASAQDELVIRANEEVSQGGNGDNTETCRFVG